MRANRLRHPKAFQAAALALSLALGHMLWWAAPSQAQGIDGPGAPRRIAVRNGDYITAVVNQEAVTAGEVERRMEAVRASLARSGQRPPPEDDLRQQVLDALIEERVIVSSARDSGVRVDEAELDRAVQSVAAQNKLTLAALREQLRAEGMDYGRFRANLRDQMLMERLREREVYQRIKISDEDIDRHLAQQRANPSADSAINLAQILISVPERADDAQVQARRTLALAAVQRLRTGEAFAKVAADLSEDANTKEAGGEMGLRPLARWPDLFAEAVRDLKVGQYTEQPVRSGAGFHILAVLQRQGGADATVTQTRARHILLRTSPQLSADVAARRLAEYRAEIASGKRSFEDLAKLFSEDSSAASGGDLGWAVPGMMVPEFESAMNALGPGGMSEPVVSRFGVHLIQVLERKEVPLDARQLREQARNVLREQKFDQTYAEWAKELRGRAYIELREPPI